MRESEQRSGSKQEQKRKIEKRYGKKDDSDLNVKVIPAKPQKHPYTTDQHLRVGVYARVSTDDPNQTSSYILQKNYYEDMVSRNPNWELIDIYADEGISGTSLNHRDEFRRLIDDCMAGKIDLIVTKSVSRFARNTEDCIHYVKQLANKRPPTGVIFEEQGIYTLSENIELSLTMNASMAQEESHIKSVSMNRSIDMRYYMKIYLTPVLIGYDHDEDGNLIINPDEAKTVRLIFLMFLCGYRCQEIADEMTRLKRLTKIGNDVWSGGSIYGILRNERHCGDLRARKTYTPNYLDHKSVKNEGERTQYYVEDHHEGIVSRGMFLAVQEKLDQAKYGFRNGSPELRVIADGVLKGFVQVNPCWMGYTEDDYLNACQSVLEEKDYLNPIIQIRKQAGDYDFRAYQVTREQFAPTTRRISASVDIDNIKFSADSLAELPGKQFIEILYHPLFEMLVVRPSDKTNRHAVKWSVYAKDRYRPCKIKGTAFLPILYRLMEWKDDLKYTLTGFVKEQNGAKVLVFYTSDAEIRLYENGRMSTAYKKEWMETFGDKYLMQLARSQAMFAPEKEWKLLEKGMTADVREFQYQPQNAFEDEMKALRTELEAELTFHEEQPQVSSETGESTVSSGAEAPPLSYRAERSGVEKSFIEQEESHDGE